MGSVSWRRVLTIEAVVLGIVGATLVLFPAAAGAAWPWELPPLAARIAGSGFLGVAAAAGLAAVWAEPRGLRVIAVMGAGTLLVPLAGLFGVIDGTAEVPGTIALAVLFGTVAAANTWLYRTVPAGSSTWGPVAGGYRIYFAVHPTAMAHAVFVTIATVAMLAHLGLFDTTRIRSWGFIGLYVVAAVCGIAATVRAARARSEATRR